MSVIIRLQNLPWTANAADIRHFFHGLAIPEGGVHIVGGQLGDAFIAFSTDEDARRGMALDGGLLKDSRVKLYLSSRTEMQNIIEEARQRHLALQAGFAGAVPVAFAVPGPSGAPFAGVRPFVPAAMIPAGYAHQAPPRLSAPFAQCYEPAVKPDHPPGALRQAPPNGQHERAFFEPATSAPLGTGYYPPQEVSHDHEGAYDASGGRHVTRDRSRRGRDPDRTRGKRSRSRSRSGSRRRSDSRERRRHSRDRPSRSGLLPTPADDDECEPGACVQFRCLNADLTYRVIRDHLGGMHLPSSNIKMINSFDGQRFGVAYVRLATKSDLHKAVASGSGSAHARAVHVAHVDDHVFDEAIDSFSPGIPLNPKYFAKSCLCLRDFPPMASVQAVREALGTIRLRRVVPERNESGTVTGLCFVELADESDARKAVQLLRDGVVIASRRVRATLLPGAELHACARRIEKLGIRSVSPAGAERSRAPRRVVLSGLAPSVLERDVADFFSDVGVMPQAVEIVTDADRIPAGHAFCTFASFQEAQRALGKNGAFMGGSTVGVALVNEPPLVEKDLRAAPQAAAKQEPPRFKGPGVARGNEQRPRGPRFAQQRPANGRPEAECGAPPGGFGAPGCVVALGNVPEHAVIADIVDFFAGFRVNDKCVFRRFGPAGEPTGDARVALPSPDEAEAAVRTLHNEYLLNRRVRLSIV